MENNGKLIGYARVSRLEQDMQLQIDALLKEGCEKKNIYTDKASGAKSDRPGLDKCIKALKKGDTLIVWRLDRLGRTMKHLVALVQELVSEGIKFKSICDGAIDTTTASGELIFNIFSALAQFERKLNQERTMAGLSVARARGRVGGRRPVKPDDPKVKMAKSMHKDHSMSITEICEALKISRGTLYRYLRMPNS